MNVTPRRDTDGMRYDPGPYRRPTRDWAVPCQCKRECKLKTFEHDGIATPCHRKLEAQRRAGL